MAETARWQAGGDLFKFKDQWVSGHRDAVLDAAATFDIPPQLLAGVAYNEVGGDPPIFDDVGQFVNPFLGKPRDQTSFGPVSIQIRRAGQSLDYGPLSKGQQQSLIESAKDPDINIYMAAKHLSDLRDIDFAGTTGKEMTAPQMEVTATRYNRGPDLSVRQIHSNLDYGKDFTKRWDHLNALIYPKPR